MLRPFRLVTLAILTLTAVGCGDDADTTPSTTTTDTGTGLTDTGTAATDTGTAATDTGSAATDTGTATGDTGTATGDTGTAADTSTPADTGTAAIQGCAEADYPIDASNNNQTIDGWGPPPIKRCIKIKAGKSVTWNSPGFNFHPLIPDGGTTPSPITRTATGTTVTFAFANAGTFGFKCEIHTTTMRGAIMVVP